VKKIDKFTILVSDNGVIISDTEIQKEGFGFYLTGIKKIKFLIKSASIEIPCHSFYFTSSYSKKITFITASALLNEINPHWGYFSLFTIQANTYLIKILKLKGDNFLITVGDCEIEVTSGDGTLRMKQFSNELS